LRVIIYLLFLEEEKEEAMTQTNVIANVPCSNNLDAVQHEGCAQTAPQSPLPFRHVIFPDTGST
jgi:hypothetical protein